MNELKDFNSNALQSLPVEAKVVDNFPQTGFFEGNLLYNFKKIYLGVSFTYQTTGSRISYIDYSGELKYDQIVSSYSIGPIIKLKLNREKRLNFNPYISTNIINSSYRLEEKVVLFTEEDNNSTDLESSGILINFGLEVIYKYEWIGAGVFIGYTQDTYGDLFLDGEEVYLEGSNQFSTNWSGIRYGINITFELNMKNM